MCTVQLRDRVQVGAAGPDLQLYQPRPDPCPNLSACPRPLLQYQPQEAVEKENLLLVCAIS